MLHRIRLAMQTGTFEKFSGRVEADETFIGGLARNMHPDKRREKIEGGGPTGKTIVMGLLQRHGPKASRIRAVVVPNTGNITLQTQVRKHVDAGSEIITDAYLRIHRPQTGLYP